MERIVKIENSTIQLSSQHNAVDKRTVQESLRMWSGERPDFEGRNTNSQSGTNVTLSALALVAAQNDSVNKSAQTDTEIGLEDDPRYLLIKLLFEEMTGMKMDIRTFKIHDAAQPTSTLQPNFGIEYERHETHYESEQTSFSADGVVKTSNGKELEFHFDLHMSREHLDQSDISLRLGNAKDPLVINFDAKGVQLREEKFNFDLNADGRMEKISFVSSGSGFLALDKNGDKKINDGSELFGPATDNGFAELAQYDEDHNNWIDESDAVYQALRIWAKNADGKNVLHTLAEKNIGAISLANISTSFDLKNNQNQLDGIVRKSGVYLSENGAAGAIQHIDLVV